MSDLGQVTAGPAGNEATIAAMADILAAVGSDGGLMEWADEDPIPPMPAGRPVPASGATVGHGAIRLLDPSDPRGEAGAAAPDPAAGAAPDARSREVVGHGTIKLRHRPALADGAGAVPETAPKEPVGHGSIRLVDLAAGPALPDMTPIATADILDALDSASS